MEAVAAGDEVARELPVVEADTRLGVEPGDADFFDLEQERQPALEPRRDQVLDDLRLSVDDDRASARELAERNAMTFAVELQLDAVVDDPLTLQSLAHAGGDEQVGRALLEHAGADSVLDVVATPILDDDGLDPFDLQQPGQRQAGRAGADDADLRALLLHSSSSTRWNTAKALFAAGTPR